MKILKKLFIVISVCALIFSSVVFTAAASYENITLYGSIDSNNSVVNKLLGYYACSPDYSPFGYYLVVRTGQYEYRLYYSKSGNIKAASNWHKVVYKTSHNTIPESYDEYDLTNTTLSLLAVGGYSYVSNIPDPKGLSEVSFDLESYNFQSIAFPCLFFLCLLLGFSVFRNRINFVRKGGSLSL